MRQFAAKILLSITLLAALGVAGCSHFKANMKKVSLGMTQEEVKTAIGKPRTVVEAAQFGETKTEIWEYPAEGSQVYRVYFTDGKVEGWKRTY